METHSVFIFVNIIVACLIAGTVFFAIEREIWRRQRQIEKDIKQLANGDKILEKKLKDFIQEKSDLEEYITETELWDIIKKHESNGND